MNATVERSWAKAQQLADMAWMILELLLELMWPVLEYLRYSAKKKSNLKIPWWVILDPLPKKNEKIPSWTIRNCKIYCGYTVWDEKYLSPWSCWSLAVELFIGIGMVCSHLKFWFQDISRHVSAVGSDDFIGTAPPWGADLIRQLRFGVQFRSRHCKRWHAGRTVAQCKIKPRSWEYHLNYKQAR